ncbi:Voltage-gated Ion Channel (VIC) Superfamily [Achlya hypogyna]|uniref:Voltage-gated Ion Channel (VIC) Superfamily n=1 Tax=Achlya hypogyna TaxID=1202772 RepID=A0A1V9YVJ2_ACHHY|nr:Voltage-gated Ion Channel (VIC) Superfamily [Achlya hypogyna]
MGPPSLARRNSLGLTLRRGSSSGALRGNRGRELWAKVRDNISVLVPPKPPQRYRRVATPPLMFNPNSDVKIRWDLMIGGCVLYTTFVVPYRVSFAIDAAGFFYVLETVLDAAFFLDIVFTFRTGIVSPISGLVYYNKQHIAVAYLKGWFLIDFFSTIPIASIVAVVDPHLNASALMTTRIFRSLKLARLLKLARFQKISNTIAKWEEEVLANQSVLALLKIIFFVFFLAHLVACAWFYAASTNPNSWAATIGLMADDHAHKQTLQYLVSVHWAIVTMATIGYGDVVPQTKLEMLIAMLVMVTGVVMFGYVVGNITALVDNINASSRMQRERITNIKEYIIVRSLPKHTGKQILDHFEYFYRQRSVFDEDAILKNIPSIIRHEVVHHVLRKFIARIDFLSEFHEGLVSDMAVAMNPFFVVRDEPIYVQHEIAAHVFFLMKGTATLVKSYVNQMGETALMQLTPGVHFGEIELYHPRFGRGIRICTAVTKTYCELTSLSRQVISVIGETWPEVLTHLEHTGEQKVRYMSKRGQLDEFNMLLNKKPSASGLRHRKPDETPSGLASSPLERRPGISIPNQLPPISAAMATFDALPVVDYDSSSSEDEGDECAGHQSHLSAQIFRIHTPAQPLMNEIKLAHHHWVLHPQDKFIVEWQLTVALGIVYSTIMVPYRIGFNSDPTGQGLVVDLVVDALFFVDILVSFRMAYYTAEHQLVVQSRTITLSYLKGWFFIDLVSTVPIDTIGSFFVTTASSTKVFATTKILRMFRIARIFKLIRLLKIGKVFKRVRDAVQLTPSSERLLKLIVIMVVFGHWNGCILHFIMLQEEDLGLRTWCTEYFFPKNDDPGLCSNRVALVDRYIASIYWAFTTMTTVGYTLSERSSNTNYCSYGDIHPYKFSVGEILFTIVCLLVNSTVYAYVVSGIIEVIYNYDPSAREYNTRLQAMKDYVRETGLSVRLSVSVRRHYEYLLSTMCLLPEEKIFSQLRPSLRFDVARLVSSNTIMTIGIIASMEKRYKGFVSYAMFLLKPQLVLRSECVCHSGSPGTEMYFIIDGEVEQLDKDNRNARVLGESGIIEAYALLAQPHEHYRMESTITVLTKSCELYAFAVQDFKTIAAISPAISSNMSYELARSIVQDDFLRLSEVQERTVSAAIEHERRYNPAPGGPLDNLANVVMTTVKVATGDILPIHMKQAVHNLVAHKDS